MGEANIPEHCRALESVKCLFPALYPTQSKLEWQQRLSMSKAGLVLASLVLSKGKVPAQTFTDLILCWWLKKTMSASTRGNPFKCPKRSRDKDLCCPGWLCPKPGRLCLGAIT